MEYLGRVELFDQADEAILSSWTGSVPALQLQRSIREAIHSGRPAAGLIVRSCFEPLPQADEKLIDPQSYLDETPLYLGPNVDDHIVISRAERTIKTETSQALELTPHEFNLISLLAQRANKALSIQMLMKGSDIITTNSVKTHVQRTRQKLLKVNKEPTAFIKTVREVGYMGILYFDPTDLL